MKDLLSISSEVLFSKGIVAWGYTEELDALSYKEYEGWVDKKLNGDLKYLSDERKIKRKNLKYVYHECESALVFLFDYRGAKKKIEAIAPKYKVASYALGQDDRDYHLWIKDRLIEIGALLSSELKGFNYQISLDVHPVLERDLAYRSGLGWFGKNSMLINREFGSYQLIGSLLINQKLPYVSKDSYEVDHCGHCTRCLDACPTKAIIPSSRTINASLCISHHTIEVFKDKAPPKGYPVESNEVFGCDICQEVCPWNVRPLKNIEFDLKSSKLIEFFNRPLTEIISDLERMSNKGYRNFFKDTALERLGKRGLLKNLKSYLNT